MSIGKEKNQVKIFQNKNLELKKPSELCQLLFFSDVTKQEYANLTPLQIDLVSTMFYLISDVINKQQISMEEIYEWSSINHFEINLQTIADMIGKYDNGYYEPIVLNLQELTKIQVLTNTLYKNKTNNYSLFHLIRKINWVKDKQTTTKRVKVWIEPELLMMFHDVKKMYTSFYLQIQYAMGSKYSKLLYDILKDYSNLGEIVIDFSTLKSLLNVDIIERPSLDKWSSFNRDILKRSVNEVSEKSDIFISYEPIKEREVKKLEVTKIKFIIKKQKSILIDYDVQDNNYNTDTHIVSEAYDDKNHTIDLYESKYKALAYKKMEVVKMLGTVIKDEFSYLNAIIKQLKKDQIDVINMVAIDEIIDSMKTKFQSEKDIEKNQLLVLHNYDKKYPIISISQEYLLYSPIDRFNITQTVEETITKINTFRNMSGEFKIIQTPGFVEELRLSYL